MQWRISPARTPGGSVIYCLGEEDGIPSAETLVRIPVEDWNRQLSPWPAPACFKGGEAFGGRAERFLDEICREIPAFEARNGLHPAHRGIAGYSLAGLCALYALCTREIFDGAASASGSFWFPGWMEFLKTHLPKQGSCVALSVGDLEKNTRNPFLQPVERRTRETATALEQAGYAAEFFLNPGNHFREPAARLGRTIDALAALWNKASEGKTSV